MTIYPGKIFADKKNYEILEVGTSLVLYLLHFSIVLVALWHRIGGILGTPCYLQPNQLKITSTSCANTCLIGFRLVESFIYVESLIVRGKYSMVTEKIETAISIRAIASVWRCIAQHGHNLLFTCVIRFVHHFL